MIREVQGLIKIPGLGKASADPEVFTRQRASKGLKNASRVRKKGIESKDLRVKIVSGIKGPRSA